MKLASIFLLAAYVLVISNQQLHNPKLLGRRPYWWQTDRQSPHYTQLIITDRYYSTMTNPLTIQTTINFKMIFRFYSTN
jgi:hypothetical protein